MNKPPSQTALLKNAAAAPLLYFDGAPVYGALNGVLEIELAARMLMPKPDGSVGVDLACVAHLRCSAQAAMSLRNALDQALAMFAPQGDTAKH